MSIAANHTRKVLRVTPPEPPRPMVLSGLQLECPVCANDLFRRRRLVLPLGDGTGGGVTLVALACARCGAVQLFDSSARSHPDEALPPRRTARRATRATRQPPAAPPSEPRWPEVGSVRVLRPEPPSTGTGAGPGPVSDALPDPVPGDPAAPVPGWPAPLPPLPDLPPLPGL